MAGTACAASGVLTVMRTSSEPACASSFTWMAVSMTSTVSVLVIDCTRTGRIATDGDHTVAPGDARLARCGARAGALPQWALGVRAHFSSRRATLSRVRCEIHRLAPEVAPCARCRFSAGRGPSAHGLARGMKRTAPWPAHRAPRPRSLARARPARRGADAGASVRLAGFALSPEGSSRAGFRCAGVAGDPQR